MLWYSSGTLWIIIKFYIVWLPSESSECFELMAPEGLEMSLKIFYQFIWLGNSYSEKIRVFLKDIHWVRRKIVTLPKDSMSIPEFFQAMNYS